MSPIPTNNKYAAMQDNRGRWMVGIKDTPRIKYLFNWYCDSKGEAREVAKEWNDIENRRK